MKNNSVDVMLTCVITFAIGIMGIIIGNSVINVLLQQTPTLNTSQSELLKILQGAFNIFPLFIIIMAAAFIISITSGLFNTRATDIEDEEYTIPIPSRDSSASRVKQNIMQQNIQKILPDVKPIEVIKNQVVNKKSEEPYVLDVSGSYIKEL